jgi:DNA-binding CsgD family transcriptional regulator
MQARGNAKGRAVARDNVTAAVLREQLAGFPASGARRALRHLMKWLSCEIDADNIIWIAAIRVLDGSQAKNDPFFGWRLRERYPLHPDPKPYQQVLAQYYQPEHYGKLTPTYRSRSHEPKIDHVGMTGRASLAGAGHFRVHRLRDKDWLDFNALRRTEHYRLYFELPGIIDRILVGVPVSSACESFVMIHRHRAQDGSRRKLFTRREAQLAGEIMRGVPELHRRLFLGNGLLTGDKPLSPTERRILNGLLDGLTEKEIASAIGQRFATTHKYVKSLYVRYGVTSRASLMALWLSGCRCAPPI